MSLYERDLALLNKTNGEDPERVVRAAFGPSAAPLAVSPKPYEFERAACLALLYLSVAKEKVTKIINDAAQHGDSAIDGPGLLRDLDAKLSDLRDDISGQFHKAADIRRGERPLC